MEVLLVLLRPLYGKAEFLEMLFRKGLM